MSLSEVSLVKMKRYADISLMSNTRIHTWISELPWFDLVLSDMLLDFHIILGLPTIAEAKLLPFIHVPEPSKPFLLYFRA